MDEASGTPAPADPAGSGAGTSGPEAADPAAGPPPLPPGLAAVWGLRERGRPGPRPGLTLTRITDAAIALADADGLGGLSMGKLAKALGFTTMSLYRYVSGKEELLVLVYDAAIGPPAEPAGGDWRTRLAGWARDLLERLRAHPWAARMPVGGGGYPVTPNQLLWMDRGIAATAGTGLTPGERASVLLLLSGYVRTQALLEADFADSGLTGGDGRRTWDYSGVLRQVLDPERTPAIAAALAAGAFDDDPGAAPGTEMERFVAEEFDFGLDRVLDGIAVLIDSRTDRSSAGG